MTTVTIPLSRNPTVGPRQNNNPSPVSSANATSATQIRRATRPTPRFPATYWAAPGKKTVSRMSPMARLFRTAASGAVMAAPWAGDRDFSGTTGG